MDLRLLLPPGWVSLPVADEDSCRRVVGELVADAAGDDGQGARLRRELRLMLTDSVRGARDGGAALLAISGPAGGLISGSLLLTFLPRGVTFQGDEPWLADEGGRVDVGQVDIGRVVRRIGRREVALDPADPELRLPNLVVDYWVTGPSGRLAHLAMSSPLIEHEEPMVELFDAVVETARWVAPGQRPTHEAAAEGTPVRAPSEG